MLWLRVGETGVDVVASLGWCGRVGIGHGEVGKFEDVGGNEAVTSSVGEVTGVVVGETCMAVVLSGFGEREREWLRSGSVKAAKKLRWVGEDGVVGDEFDIDEDDDSCLLVV